MNKLLRFLSVFILMLLVNASAFSQCAMCTKTAQQLGEKPAQGLNNAILYLMMAPFFIMGYIGYRWYKNQKIVDAENAEN